MVVLFLDFDGVLHDFGHYRIVATNLGFAVRGEPFAWADHLEQVLREFPGVQIVVHSSWRRLFTDAELREMLPPGLRQRFLGTTDLGERHETIVQWCMQEGPTGYVVLDDSPAEFPDDMPELVVCVTQLGITSPRAKKQLREALAVATGEASAVVVCSECGLENRAGASGMLPARCSHCSSPGLRDAWLRSMPSASSGA